MLKYLIIIERKKNEKKNNKILHINPYINIDKFNPLYEARTSKEKEKQAAVNFLFYFVFINIFLFFLFKLNN